MNFKAIEIHQGSRKIYSFCANGKQVPEFATVSRISRSDQSIIGYQRPEARNHIHEIRKYIDSENPMIPNSIVIAFDKTVSFIPECNFENGCFGTLVIPESSEISDESKPGLIVDGQQRVAAVRESDANTFVLSVNAFIANDEAEQREQFILVNSVKPLPKGLIHELLPMTNSHLPTSLSRKKFPSALLERLNHDERSPFFGIISTPTTLNGIVKDNSILKMLENSLSDGALYDYRDPSTGSGDVEAMTTLLIDFWSAVAEVFSEDWGKKPKFSRLLHGVGILSLGILMDSIADKAGTSREIFSREILRISGYCAWSSGHWSFDDGPRNWNDLQNTGKDIQSLSTFLSRTYRNSFKNDPSKKP